jgi:outer membrane protein TolC
MRNWRRMSVADVLCVLQDDARIVKEARAAETTARANLAKVRAQQNAGTVSQLVVIDSPRAYLATAISRLQAEANRLTNTVALYTAVGGGTV